MSFLLVEHGSRPVPSWQDLTRPQHRQATGLASADVVDWALDGFRLRVAGPARACRLPLPGEDGAGPFWLALDGYLEADGGAGNGPCATPGQSPVQWLAARLLRDGAAALEQLRGCFSLCAVWPRQGRWLLYRSRLGGRGAYHHQGSDGGWRAAASCAAALAALRGYRFSADPAYLASVMALRMPPPPGHSPFQDIAELPAGACLVAGRQQLTLHTPALAVPGADRAISQAQANRRFAETFHRAVRRTLADPLAGPHDDSHDGQPAGQAPVAVMLSGGLDSSPVAAVAAALLAGRGRLLPVSWALPGHPDADESSWVERTCRYLGLEPLRLDGTTCLPFSRLDGTAINPEVPHFNPYRGLMDACYDAAATAGCRIVLNGNAGDLLYPPGSLRLLDLWQRRQLRQLWQALGYLVRRCGWRGALRQPEVRRLLARPGRRRQPRPPPWLGEQARAVLPPSPPPPAVLAGHPWPDYAWQLLGPRMAFGRAQENVAANRRGVDRRDPFHDEELARLMLSLPVHTSLGLHPDKHLMREAMRGHLPEAVRRKGRTGLLHGFLAAGFQRHRQQLQALLAGDDTWRELVEPRWLQQALASPDTGTTGQLVIGQCAGLVLWRDYWRS